MCGGSADAQILTAQLIADKTVKWGEQVGFLNIDPVDAFGRMRLPDIWQALVKRTGAGAGMGSDEVHRMPLYGTSPDRDPGEEMPMCKACRQGPPESTFSWNMWLGDGKTRGTGLSPELGGRA